MHTLLTQIISSEQESSGLKKKNMESLRELVRHPDHLYYLLKLKMDVRRAVKEIPPEPHWNFCYTTLFGISRSMFMLFQPFEPQFRNAVSNLFKYMSLIQIIC